MNSDSLFDIDTAAPAPMRVPPGEAPRRAITLSFDPDAWVAPHARARAEDHDTSWTAALNARRSAPRLRDACLAALRDHPEGLTDHELGDLVGTVQTSAGKRRGELVRLGMVEATERRRRTPSGATAIVWRAVP